MRAAWAIFAGACIARSLSVRGFTPGEQDSDVEVLDEAPEIDSLEEASQDGCSGFEQHLSRAAGLMGRGDFVTAKDGYDAVLEAAPDCVDALVGSGRLTAFFGDLEGAEARYQRALELQPRSPAAHLAMGKVHSFQMRWDEALESFETCAALAEGDPPLQIEVLSLLVRVYCWMGDGATASETAQVLLERAPGQAGEPFLNFDMAISHMVARDTDAAHAAMSRAMAATHGSISPGSMPPALPDFSIIGDMLLQHQHYDLAARAFQWTLDVTENILQLDSAEDRAVDAYFAVRIHLTLGVAQAREIQGDQEAGKDAYAEILDMASAAESGGRVCPLTQAMAAAGAARLGLLQLGLGLRNQGAARACGRPVEDVEAARRLGKLVSEWIGDTQGGQEVQDFRDAVAWCDEEHAQADAWRQRRKRLLPKSLFGKVRAKVGRLARGLQSRLPGGAQRERRAKASEEATESLNQTLRKAAQPIEIINYENRDDGRLERDLRQCLLGEQPFIFRPVPEGPSGTTQAVRDKVAGAATKGRGARPPDQLVVASLSPTTRFDGPLEGKALGLGVDEILMRPATASLYLRDFLAFLRYRSQCEAQGQECPLPHMYVEYLALHQYPLRVLEDLKVPDAGDHVLSNLWLGGSATVSPLHYDDWGNLLEQIYGTKEVLIFPPAAIHGLAYRPRHRSTYAYEFPNTFNVSAFDPDLQVLFGSSLQLDAPVSEANGVDAATMAQAQIASLGPGDILCMPAFWHHEVRSAPEPVADGLQLNLAVNHWYLTEAIFEEEEMLFG